MPARRLATGVAPLDTLLEGGFETDCITELYGEGGSGKTIVCLDVALRVARAGEWVVYIDSEGVSVARLEAIAGADLPKLLTRFLLSSPKGLEEQTRAVASAATLAADGKRRVGLIVLDSATHYYRLSLASDSEEDGRHALATELGDLAATAIHSEIPVLVTNQVWRSPKTGALEPLGGSMVNHVAKTILRLERLTGARRRAVLVKHRSIGERSADFAITDRGLSA